MVIEAVLARNYNQFIHKKRNIWLPCVGVLLIILGFGINLFTKKDKQENLLKSPDLTIENQVPKSLKTESIVSFEKPNNKSDNKVSNVKFVPAKAKIISNYLLVDQSVHRVDYFLSDIQTLIENEGSTVSLGNNKNYSIMDLKGFYNKLLVLSGEAKSYNTSVDQNAITTIYIYSIKIYDVETSTLLKSLTNKLVTVGFSEFENLEKIRQDFLIKMKPLL